MRVLIVEDNPVLAFMIEQSLAEAGHEVLGPAPTMASALAVVAQAAPDLALIDINLDGSGTGIDLARELSGRGVLVFYATGQVDMARAAAAYAGGVMCKPFSPELVVQVVDAIDHRRGGKERGGDAGGAAFPPEVELFERAKHAKG